MADFNESRIILDSLSEKGKNVFEVTPEQTGGMTKPDVIALLANKFPSTNMQVSKIPITKKNVSYTLGTNNSIIIKDIPYVLYYGIKYDINPIYNVGIPTVDGRYAIVILRNDNEDSYRYTVLRDENIASDDDNPTSKFIKNNEQNGLLLGVWFYIKNGKLDDIIINENIGFYGHYDVPYYTNYDNPRKRTNIVMVSDNNSEIDYEQ